MTDTISEQLFIQFHQCASLLHRRRSRFHHESGMDRHAQGRLLVLLTKMNGATQKELATILGIRPPSLSELVAKLERARLVQRQANESDKRIMDISITPEGVTYVENAQKGRAQAASDMFSGLNAQEQEQLSGLLSKLITTLEKDAHFDQDDDEGHGPHHHHEHGHHGAHARHHRHGRGMHPHAGPDGRGPSRNR